MMKKLPYLLLLFLTLGCNYRQKKKINFDVSDTTANSLPVLPDDKDSVWIQDYPEKIKETKGTIRRILKFHPELQSAFTQQPDISYKLDKENASHNGHVMDFTSEVGQDNYFTYYAYFLKTKNGNEKYQTQRKTLTDIYLDINSLFGKLSGGGTYYSHQYSRIAGYAEYAIYRGAGNDYYQRTYPISRQKQLYISSLKQLINDELSNNFDITEKDKPALKKGLLETVNHINGLITNFYYLKMTQEFQYSNY
ncbi:MAG: hypothetical protein V4592_15100 [Bacteroidota bacterium]